MKPTLLAVRAIGAEFANRIFITSALVTAGISIVFIALIVWLTSLSAWWWLLGVILIFIMAFAVTALIVAKVIINSVRPTQDRTQKQQTKAFVDKLQELSEVMQTPHFVLLFQAVRDIALPRENGFIASLSSETTSLKNDFIALTRSFKK
ncbi:MAG TPA: hypothetical protein VD907_00950 [Verrucomicrobiae bacterium]|nr:hypothetical protein [Verrucomicrobiae bacterium]